MSSIEKEKIEAVREILRKIHEGYSVEDLKREFRDVLRRVAPFEIPLIEQQLVKEGVSVSDILKLCDLHVELFREFLEVRELKGVPKGHPVDLLVRENDFIVKQAEVLGVYAGALSRATEVEAIKNLLGTIKGILRELRKFRIHYRKIQMLIFPYLERRGIVAVPRVLWGREDQVIVKIRELSKLIEKAEKESLKYYREVASKAMEIAREASELVFRENKILFPAVLALLSEGEWAVIHEIGKEIGYIVEVKEEWRPSAPPVYPYEIEGVVTPEQISKLPEEFRDVILKTLKPDTYQLKRDGDIEFSTGYLSKEEIEGIFRALPLEVTYANVDDRVRFYTQSVFHKGFVRTKTILGRRIEFCHPPRLEKMVMLNVERIKKGVFERRTFWTKLGDRIIRVIIAAVRDREGKLLGTLEIVEDLTEVINKPEDIKKKIMVL